MNKLFKTIVGAAVGLTMAIGVGVAVSGNNAQKVNATGITTTYTKVTSSSLSYGDVVIITNAANNKALSGISNTSPKYGTYTAVTESSSSISVTENTDIEEFVVVAGNASGSYAFAGTNHMNGYLYWGSGNSLNTSTTFDDKVSWTIAYSNGSMTIKSVYDTTRVMRFNSDRFACYSSNTGTLLNIFKATERKGTNVLISERASTNNWSNATVYSGWSDTLSFATFTQEGGGNNGKSYDTGSSWRFYNGGTVKITLASNYVVASVLSNPAYSFTLNGNVASYACTATISFKQFTIVGKLKAPSVEIDYDGETSLEYDGSLEQTISMTATATNISGTISYNWISSDTDSLCIDTNGGSSATFYIYGSGTPSITVQAKVNGDVKATSSAINFTITNKDYPGTLTITSSSSINIDLAPEGAITYSLNRTYTDNDLDLITVSSSDEDVIAFVDENPLAYTAIGDAGDTATITLTLACSYNELEVYVAQQLITLTDGVPVTGLSLNFHSRTVKLGGSTMTLKATITPTNATNKTVIWESNNDAVVTVSGSEPNENAESVGTLTGVNAGTATITAKSAYDNAIVDSATVTVNAPDDKALQSIEIVKGAGAKTRYVEADTTVDTTGLSLNARYTSPTVATYDETISVAANAQGVTWTLDKTNKKVIASYGGFDDNFDITVSRDFSKSAGEYHLMTSNTLEVGDHIAIGGTVTAKDKEWSGKDFVMSSQASNNVRGAQVTVSSKNIIANDESNNTDKANVKDIELVEGAVEGSFALKVGNNAYLGSGSTSNRLVEKDSITNDSSFIFTYDTTTHLWSIVCQSTTANARNYMYINANSGATGDNDFRLFACYGDTTPATGYNYLKVYKFEFYVDEAEAYAKQFNEANICGTDIYTKASGTLWGAQETLFGKLTLGAQNMFTNATGTSAEFLECLERYDRVIYLHYTLESATYHDFMGRVANNSVTPKTSHNALGFVTEGNGTTSIIVVIALVSISALGGFFFLRKRKEQ